MRFRGRAASVGGDDVEIAHGLLSQRMGPAQGPTLEGELQKTDATAQLIYRQFVCYVNTTHYQNCKIWKHSGFMLLSVCALSTGSSRVEVDCF